MLCLKWNNGKPWVQLVDEHGKVHVEREATVGEAAVIENTEAMVNLRYAIENAMMEWRQRG